MRISDWSSDVCSSDLGERALATHVDAGGGVDARRLSGDPRRGQLPGGLGRDARDGRDAVGVVAGDDLAQAVDVGEDRKSGVSGKSGSVRVDLGGRRNRKKKKRQQKNSKL